MVSKIKVAPRQSPASTFGKRRLLLAVHRVFAVRMPERAATKDGESVRWTHCTYLQSPPGIEHPAERSSGAEHLYSNPIAAGRLSNACRSRQMAIYRPPQGVWQHVCGRGCREESSCKDIIIATLARLCYSCNRPLANSPAAQSDFRSGQADLSLIALDFPKRELTTEAESSPGCGSEAHFMASKLATHVHAIIWL